MNAQLQTIPQPQTEPIQSQPQFNNIPRWNLALRIAFRFSVVYLGLYCYATEISPACSPLPGDLEPSCPIRPLSGRCAP